MKIIGETSSSGMPFATLWMLPHIEVFESAKTAAEFCWIAWQSVLASARLLKVPTVPGVTGAVKNTCRVETVVLQTPPTQLCPAEQAGLVPHMQSAVAVLQVPVFSQTALVLQCVGSSAWQMPAIQTWVASVH